MENINLYGHFRDAIARNDYKTAYDLFAGNPDLLKGMSFDNSIKYHRLIKDNIGEVESEVFKYVIGGMFGKFLLGHRNERKFHEIFENLQSILDQMQ